jgi:hypothetical protein
VVRNPRGHAGRRQGDEDPGLSAGSSARPAPGARCLVELDRAAADQAAAHQAAAACVFVAPLAWMGVLCRIAPLA